MQKQDFNNKQEKQGFDDKLLKDLNRGLLNLSEVIDGSMKVIDETIKDKLTEKQAINFNAFKDKLISLTLAGKLKEAQELKEAFKKQFSE